MHNLQVTNQVQVVLAHNKAVHRDLVMETIRGWAKLDTDLVLVPQEGPTVHTQRILLSCYSRLVRETTETHSRISVPVSERALQGLLEVLVSGKLESSDKQYLAEVKLAASLIGINTFFLNIVQKKKEVKNTTRSRSSLRIEDIVKENEKNVDSAEETAKEGKTKNLTKAKRKSRENIENEEHSKKEVSENISYVKNATKEDTNKPVPSIDATGLKDESTSVNEKISTLPTVDTKTDTSTELEVDNSSKKSKLVKEPNCESTPVIEKKISTLTVVDTKTDDSSELEAENSSEKLKLVREPKGIIKLKIPFVKLKSPITAENKVVNAGKKKNKPKKEPVENLKKKNKKVKFSDETNRSSSEIVGKPEDSKTAGLPSDQAENENKTEKDIQKETEIKFGAESNLKAKNNQGPKKRKGSSSKIEEPIKKSKIAAKSTDNVVSALAESTDNVAAALAESTDNVVSALSESTDNVAQALAESTDNVSPALAESTDNVSPALAESTDNVASAPTESTDKVASAPTESTDKISSAPTESTDKVASALTEPTDKVDIIKHIFGKLSSEGESTSQIKDVKGSKKSIDSVVLSTVASDEKPLEKNIGAEVKSTDNATTSVVSSSAKVTKKTKNIQEGTFKMPLPVSIPNKNKSGLKVALKPKKDILKVRSRSRSSSRSRYDQWQMITRKNSSMEDKKYKELKEKNRKSKMAKTTATKTTAKQSSTPNETTSTVNKPNENNISNKVDGQKESEVSQKVLNSITEKSNMEVSKLDIGLSESEGENQLFQQEFIHDIDFGEYDQSDVDAVNDLDTEDETKMEAAISENTNVEKLDDSIKLNTSKRQVIEYQFDDIDMITDIDRVKVKRDLNEEFRKPGEDDGEESSLSNAVESAKRELKVQPVLPKKDLRRKSLPANEDSKVIASTTEPINTAAAGDIEKTIEEIDKTIEEIDKTTIDKPTIGKPRERNLEAKIKVLTELAKKNTDSVTTDNSDNAEVTNKSGDKVVARKSLETDNDFNGNKFKCETCPKTFKFKNALNNHTIVHSGEKPFKCDQCSYACNQKGNLKVHTTRKHGS